MIRRPHVLIFLAAVGLAAPAPAASTARADGKPKPADLVLADAYPPLPAEHAVLSSVPWAPTAPAVILLEAQQHEQMKVVRPIVQRVDYYRRLKILTPEGLEAWGRFERTLFGPLRIEKVEARTILKDGSAVDASPGVARDVVIGETARTDVRTISVTWPRVEVGAILDLHVVLNVDGFPVERWEIQKDLPVLDSRLIVLFPDPRAFNRIGFLLSKAEITPQSAEYPRGTVHVWRWTDVPPVSREPFGPAGADAVQSLIVHPAPIPGVPAYDDFPLDWTGWARKTAEIWNDWLARKADASASLGLAACDGLSRPRDKAEAIRRVVVGRLKVTSTAVAPTAESPDDVLARGSGTVADVAGVAIAMMRGAGVDPTLVAYRRRSSGRISKSVAVASMLDEAMLRVGAGADAFWFAPASSLAAGTLPPDARGVSAIVLDRKSPGIVEIPRPSPEENRISRAATVTTLADGSAEVDLTAVHSGAASIAAREAFGPLDDAARRNEVLRRLAIRDEGGQVIEAEFEGLDRSDGDLVVRAKLRLPAHATADGAPRYVGATLFERFVPSDWSAASRATDIDLGEPREVVDVARIVAASTTAPSALPEPVSLEAPPIGAFTQSYASEGGAVVVTRTLRLAVPRLAAAAWPIVRAWGQGIAEADARKVAVASR